MKKVVSSVIVVLLITVSLYAQIPPEKMSYQIVIRDNNNELVVNQNVGAKISILASQPNGLAVYEETHTGTTNANGLLTLMIGTGIPTPGSLFSNIKWGEDDFYLKSEIDPAGGTNYTITGTQQLITVPYAFHSGTTAYVDFNQLANRPIGTNAGDIVYWDPMDSSWRVLPVGTPGQVLTAQNNGLAWITNPSMVNNIAPTIVTDTVYDITGYTMTVQATIVNNGSTGIIASGVCWSSTNPSPSIGNNYTTDGSSVGSFTSSVFGLNSNTTYYVCAYATNSVGTSYGNVITITTPTHCGTVTDIDGNTYNTVYVGRQCWFKENLRTKTYADGIKIPLAVNTVTSYDMGSINHKRNTSACFYYSENDSTASRVKERGLLYNWPAVMKGAGSSNSNPSGILGICPYGWHVPSSSEWCELENLLNLGIDVNCNNNNWRGTMAKMLSAPKYWSTDAGNSFFPGYWTTDSTDFNTTGFTLIPNGRRYETYYNNYLGSNFTVDCGHGGGWHDHYYYPQTSSNYYAYFWTTVSGEYRQFATSQTGAYYGKNEATTSAMSVRCVKDYN